MNADEVNSRYEVLKVINSGLHGVFSICRDHRNNNIVGRKQIRLPEEDREAHRSTLVRYCIETILALLMPSHPNINRFIGSERENDNVVAFVEIVPGRTLQRWNSAIDPHDQWPRKLDFVIQIVDALIFVRDHFTAFDDGAGENSFFHGDLHTENIMITPEGRAVLIDWGQSYMVPKRRHLYPAVAPEFLPGSPYHPADGRFGTVSDVFSIGVMTWFLLTGTVPYGNKPYRPQDREECNAIDPDTVDEEHWKRLADRAVPRFGTPLAELLIGAVCPDPKRRSTLEELRRGLASVQRSMGGFDRFPLVFNNPSPTSAEIEMVMESMLQCLDLIVALEDRAAFIRAYQHVALYYANNRSCLQEGTDRFLARLSPYRNDFVHGNRSAQSSAIGRWRERIRTDPFALVKCPLEIFVDVVHELYRPIEQQWKRDRQLDPDQTRVLATLLPIVARRASEVAVVGNKDSVLHQILLTFGEIYLDTGGGDAIKSEILIKMLWHHARTTLETPPAAHSFDPRPQASSYMLRFLRAELEAGNENRFRTHFEEFLDADQRRYRPGVYAQEIPDLRRFEAALVALDRPDTLESFRRVHGSYLQDNARFGPPPSATEPSNTGRKDARSILAALCMDPNTMTPQFGDRLALLCTHVPDRNPDQRVIRWLRTANQLPLVEAILNLIADAYDSAGMTIEAELIVRSFR
jgi:serine/threonine protein kinase